MKLTVNGKETELHRPNSNITVSDLLQSLDCKGEFFAVAVNMNCVPQGQYSETHLNEGDWVEILSPMQGG